MFTAMKLVAGSALLVLPTLAGCDRPVAHEEKVEVKSDGTVKKEETTVTQRPDGTIVKEQTETKRETK